MITLEMIHLRMSGKDPETLEEIIRATLEADARSPDLRIYRHARVEGDLLIQIHRRGADGRDEPSELGLRLASILRAYGMVGHAVWVRREA